MIERTPVVNVDCEQVTAGVPVANVPAVVEFYTKKLGFKVGFLYIQELKKKHGIDYDTHGSYRFTEE
jgi:catechol 2,3-dioxygenase-like lactoylglutathione lyase family enzyme